MAFQIDKFLKTKFEDRIDEVPVPELREFFDPDEEPVFKVRQLTAEEVFFVRQAHEKAANVSETIVALSQEVSPGIKAEQILDVLGMGSKNTPADLVRYFEIIVRGSVEPKLDKRTVVRIGADRPTVVTKVAEKILQLTGMGRRIVGESNASGAKKGSKKHS